YKCGIPPVVSIPYIQGVVYVARKLYQVPVDLAGVRIGDEVPPSTIVSCRGEAEGLLVCPTGRDAVADERFALVVDDQSAVTKSRIENVHSQALPGNSCLVCGDRRPSFGAL